MVIVKTAREISKMKDACRISAEALRVAGEAVKPGITTYEIDTIVRKYIEKQGATPSFLGYGGCPASACISVNNVVIHGIPSKKQILKEGDSVSVDVGAFYEGLPQFSQTRRPDIRLIILSSATSMLITY